MAKITISNINSPAAKLWLKIENILLIVLIPAVVLVLTNWGFTDEVFLNRLLLLINTLLVAIIKGIGLFLTDSEETKPKEMADAPPGDGAGTPGKGL